MCSRRLAFILSGALVLLLALLLCAISFGNECVQASELPSSATNSWPIQLARLVGPVFGGAAEPPDQSLERDSSDGAGP